MSNRYNSIVETMRAPLFDAQSPPDLGDFGSIPGVVNIPVSNSPYWFLGASGSDAGGGAAGIGFFDLRDIPMIRDIGIWSNLADGLAPDPEIDRMMIMWDAVDGLGADMGHIAWVNVPTITLNTQTPYEVFREFTSEASRQRLASFVAAGAAATRLVMRPGESIVSWPFAAYSMSANWSIAKLQMHVQATVEHTFPLKPDLS